MKSSVHCFEIEDAKNYGVECAVIVFNIRHWLDKNKANKKHEYEGRVWTYNSAKAFSELFPYLTQRQIYNRLSKLEESGLLISGNFNKAGYDRTKWYSLNEASYAILPNGEMDLPKRSNAFTETVEPIPDINTNINTHTIEQSSFIPSLKECQDYAIEKGFSGELGKKFYDYYNISIEGKPNSKYWKDSRGKPVKGWKQKMHIWFKPENRKEKQNKVIDGGLW